MKAVKTEILINAPMERVWDILTDFDKYPDWNPFILSVKGNLKPESKLINTLKLPGKKPMVFKPRITNLEAGRSFSWLGNTFIPGLFDGAHSFRLEPAGAGKTRFIHGEKFTGMLSGLFFRMLGEATIRGFESMNQALRARAES